VSGWQPVKDEPLPSPAGYVLRLARKEDLDCLEALLLALQDHLEAANPGLWQMKAEARRGLRAQLANRLQADDMLTLVAEHADDGVVGVINGRLIRNTRYSPSQAGTIDQAFVRPDHRRRGVGAALVAAICGVFANQGVDDLSLRYVVGNEEAAGFWTFLGFEPRIITTGTSRGQVEARLAARQRQGSGTHLP
jgi:GNAT superfamily N-acetyltransferase